MCVRWIFKLKLMCGPWACSEQWAARSYGWWTEGWWWSEHAPSFSWVLLFPSAGRNYMKCWHGEKRPPRWARDSLGGTECRQPGRSSGAGLCCPRYEADADSWASPQEVWLLADVKPRGFLHTGKLHSLQLYLFKKTYCIEVWLIYKFVLISVRTAKWLSYAHTFFFIFFPFMVYHRILIIFPYAVQQALVVYLFYIY